MGMISGISKTSFKLDENGRTCFYPYGVFGRGVIVDDVKKKQQITTFLRIYFPIGVICVLAATILFGWMISLVICIVVCLIHWLVISIMIRKLPLAGTKLTIQETLRTTSSENSVGVLVLFFLLALSFVVCGIVIVFQRKDMLIIGIFGTIFFGFIAFLLGYTIIKNK